MIALSCDKEDNPGDIREEMGEVWLSGGLHYCAEQVRLDNGDTLVVPMEKIISFLSGDRVNVRYKEIGINENCPQYIDCEIIELKKIEKFLHSQTVTTHRSLIDHFDPYGLLIPFSQCFKSSYDIKKLSIDGALSKAVIVPI